MARVVKEKRGKTSGIKQVFQGTTAVPLNLPKRSHDQILEKSTLTHAYCMTRAKDEHKMSLAYSKVLLISRLLRHYNPCYSQHIVYVLKAAA